MGVMPSAFPPPTAPAWPTPWLGRVSPGLDLSDVGPARPSHGGGGGGPGNAGDPGDGDGGDRGGGGDGWVTLAMFWSTVEAHLARLKLEAEGVPVLLIDENLSNTQLFAVATGGVKLMVPRDQQARARLLLDLAPVDAAELARQAGDRRPDAGGAGWAAYLVLPVLLSPLLLAGLVGQAAAGLAVYLLLNAVGGLYLVSRT